MTPHDTDPLAARMRAARPELDRDAVEASSTELARSIMASRPQRRSLRLAAIVLAVTAVAVPSVATAYQWTTHTGWFGNPTRFTEDVDDSEVLDLCAPDFRATADKLVPAVLPLPKGLTVAMVADTLFATKAPDCADGGALMQATGVTARYASYAKCSWINVYLDDRSQRLSAAHALAALADSELNHTIDGGGVVAHDKAVAAAAAGGDMAAVRDEQQVNCENFGWRP